MTDAMGLESIKATQTPYYMARVGGLTTHWSLRVARRIEKDKVSGGGWECHEMHDASAWCGDSCLSS